MGKYKRLKFLVPVENKDRLLYEVLSKGYIEFLPPEETSDGPEQGDPSDLQRRIGEAKIALEAIRKYGNIKEGLIRKKEIVKAERFWGDNSVASRACSEVCGLLKNIDDANSEKNASSENRAKEMDAEIWAIEGAVFAYRDLYDEIKMYIDRLGAELLLEDVRNKSKVEGDSVVLNGIYQIKDEDEIMALLSRFDSSYGVFDIDRKEKVRPFNPLKLETKYVEIIGSL